METKNRYREYIYEIVARIPEGKVMSYGQIARIVPRCTARMVGFAMSSCPDGLPWQRVINSQGKISPRGVGYGAEIQKQLLLEEGVAFDQDDKIDFDRFGWQPE